MDVTFTNVLEGARQYFQGLPTGTNGSPYPNSPDQNQQQQQQQQQQQHQQQPQIQRNHESAAQNPEIHVPSPNNYWPPQTIGHQAPQVSAPHSLESRSPSSSQTHYAKASSQDQQIRNQNQNYPTPYYQTPPPSGSNQQMYPFQRPPTSEPHQQYQSHIMQNPAYHHHQQPQQQQSSSHQQHQTSSPDHRNAASQSYQVQSSVNLPQPYSNYQNNRPFYPPQSSTNNTSYSTPSTQVYSHIPQTSQNSSNFKNTYQNPPQNQQSLNVGKYVNTLNSNNNNNNQQHQNQPQNAMYAQSQASRLFQNTHQAPLSSASAYSVPRTSKESSRSAQSKPKTYHPMVSPIKIPVATPSSRLSASEVQVPEYRSNFSFQNRLNQSYASTITTQSYPTVTTTSHQTSNSYTSHTLTTANISSYNQNKTASSNVSYPNQSATSQNNFGSTGSSSSQASKNKRESPLDLSVKTVRIPADSTLDDSDNERARHRPTNPPLAANYSNFDAPSNTFQRANVQRTVPNVSAPKVDFLPNFNVSSINNRPEHYRPPTSTTVNVPTPPLRSLYEKSTNPTSQPNILYPTVTVPSISHMNSHIQSTSRKLMEPPPRSEFPSPGHGHKTSALYPIHTQNIPKKRPADTAPSISSNKVPKVDAWRQTIDQQIEQKLFSYKQLHQPVAKYSSSQTKNLVANGSYNNVAVDRPKEFLNYQQQQQQSRSHYQSLTHQSYNSSSTSQYNHQPNLNQTYVPSPANTQYSGHSIYPHHHKSSFNSGELNRSNSIPSLASKNNVGGAADKRVLSLLRNSIETKGVKEAQRKFEQEQNKSYEILHHRSDVQHPSTDVTAPLQPKPFFIGRQNISPFTANSLPESNTIMAPFHSKLQIPKAINSVHFDSNRNKGYSETAISSENDESNPGLDGLAAFLAARIRTKAELKQVSHHGSANVEAFQKLHQDATTGSLNSSSSSISPPKLTKEIHSTQPRKRLFSRTEDDSRKTAPPRDKSGMRSSSETSVFDFPDSDSENEMPVLELQTLGAMRRDRKSSIKHTQSRSSLDVETKQTNEELPVIPPSPEDDFFAKTCDNFMEQLKAGVGKKRGRRKKLLEADVLAKLESVTKEKPIIETTTIKVEPDVKLETDIGNQSIQPSTVDSNNETNETRSEISIEIKEEVDESKPLVTEQPEAAVVKCDPDASDSDNETIKQLSDKLKIRAAEELIKKQANAISKTAEENVATKPIKKPAFGDGSDFYPGWEEEVYKYKKSLRMPPSLIQVRKVPPTRLSTSLPDLDPCPISPASPIVSEKDEICSRSKLTKVKSEPIDSDSESNSSFHLFHSKPNYDSEESGSIKSFPDSAKENNSILDKLLQKYGRKKRKYKKKNDENGPKTIPKAENLLELLPTPSLEIKKEDKKKETIIKTDSAILGFRKKTVNIFKDAFLNRSNNNLIGVSDQFATVVLKSRTRKESRAMKQRATIKEVFGEDRPASAPPVPYVDNIKNEKGGKKLETKDKTPKIEKDKENKNKITNEIKKSKEEAKAEIVPSKIDSKKTTKSIARKEETKQDIQEDEKEIGSKSGTPSVDGDDGSHMKKRGRFSKMRRKFSSGFDYIRKKKKQTKKENVEEEVSKTKKRGPLLKAVPESEQDIHKEIKTWVLNKGIGETHLHRSARLGYIDIVAYCLERMECNPSPKDNAGYTPLHEACSRGHLEIAKLLLMYGANVSDSAQGGVRPLHEAVENGYVEIVRLLLSYGADPTLATYGGSTPLALATEEPMIAFLTNHLADVRGLPSEPWIFPGPATCFDPKETGYNILGSPPKSDPQSEDEDVAMEISENLLPNLYTLPNESPNDRWVLLQDLSNILKIKSRDALLRQLSPSSVPSTPASHRSLVRELKTSDFLEGAHCCQFLNAGEKINFRATKIALVKYTDKVKQLLRVEEFVIKSSPSSS